MDPTAAPVGLGTVLGQGGGGAGDWTGVMYAVVVLTVLLLAGFGAIVLARRYITRTPRRDDRGFELHQLRKLLADGTISQEEFDHLRNQLIRQIGTTRDTQSGE
jgi:uncharacterized membrane protein